MKLTNAKKRILDVALELFSTYGYEATSVGQIADALGIKKPSLYSHFAGKQEIFETLMEETSRVYEQHSLFSQFYAAEIPEIWKQFKEMTPEQAAVVVREQMAFLIHDPIISKVRKLLTIEQYRSNELAIAQEQRAYTDILNYHRGLITYLIEQGVLIAGDVETMALQYMAPISLQLYRVDRNPSCEEEAMGLIEKHIIHFSRQYGKKVWA